MYANPPLANSALRSLKIFSLHRIGRCKYSKEVPVGKEESTIMPPHYMDLAVAIWLLPSFPQQVWQAWWYQESGWL